MRIRRFDRKDLGAICAIQATCEPAAVWTQGDYLRLATKPHGLVWVAELDTATSPKVVGFAAFHRIIDEAELLNLAVDPEHQHQGIARALVEYGRDRLRELGTKRIFLEARLSNKPALGLYYSMGFGLHSLRKGYYHNPPEDAYVLCLQIFVPETISTTARA